ncbi:MAG: signal recognition particle protein [Eubacteriales bacterium]|nr:signal recognition particle protein [Eubacteriales bacterium]
MQIFEGLSAKLQETIKKIRSSGRVTEKDIKEMMREIKIALIEADVNFLIVKDFIKKVSERASGSEILESLTPGQQIVKIVNEELTELLGSTQSRLTFSSSPPTIYMLAGLQGSGKTTTCGKLAALLRKQGKKPVMVACDVYRPAAVKQLEVVGAQLDIPVFKIDGSTQPVMIAKKAVEHAVSHMFDVVLLDTAGRLHIDEELMKELSEIKKAVKPQEILLVVDSMTGQDAVNTAGGFNEKLGIDGVILTKLDGDTRGGAAISVKSATGKPIKFAATGEKLSDLEPFYPDRMAGRILGMGDVLGLIEKAQEAFDEKKAAEMEARIRKSAITLDDYLEQMQQIKKMGSISELVGMIPGMNAKQLDGVNFDQKKMDRMEAIIKSMTLKERIDPSILNAGRRRRIASGSGTTVQDVNSLLKSFEGMKNMMKSFNNMGKRGRKGFPGLGRNGGDFKWQ